MIVDTITKKIAEAMKARDEIRLSTLRMLSSAFNYERIAKQHDLSGDEELVVVKKEAKKRTDAIEALKAAEGKKTSSTPEQIREKILKEQKELMVLKEFLPEQMDDSALEKIVLATIRQMNASSLAEMGAVIGQVRAKVGMQAEGARIAELVRKKLQ
jgi:uncharacterized protein YqeY